MYLRRLPATEITIDPYAAGYGWFVDDTLRMDMTSSFRYWVAIQNMRKPDSDAFDRIDLLSVLIHEIGHSLGLFTR